MNSNISLIILAGGLGSRYNGSKQIDVLGPQEAYLLEFAIHDAVKAGFSKVILVVNPLVKEQMIQKLSKWNKSIACVIVLQTLSDRQQLKVSKNRMKPWGTTQAVLSAKDCIETPFVVMNADDYYGPSVMRQAFDFFQDEKVEHGLIAFRLSHTLSSFGGVSRGICTLTAGNELGAIMEEHQLKQQGNEIIGQTGNKYTAETLVSMNFWLFQRSILDHLEAYFERFFKASSDHLDAECYLPTAIQDGIQSKQFKVQVLTSVDRWVGLTFSQDRLEVEHYLRKLTESKLYPKSFADE